MVKSLSVMLLFVVTEHLYEGILTSASPMVADCQHVCKRFALSIQIYCSTAYKTLSANQY